MTFEERKKIMDYARFGVFDSHGKDGTMWVGFDLDGTLAEYDGWKGNAHIGKPLKTMVLIAKQYHGLGKKVKIFTINRPRKMPNL